MHWQSDPRRFITLRYLSGEGPRELRLHAQSAKEKSKVY
jgi:hypothetical protein